MAKEVQGSYQVNQVTCCGCRLTERLDLGIDFQRIEVMVTSEMIGAGIDELKAYEDGSGETACETVTRIYLAMLQASLGRTSLG
jgi:hypothetical protein